jgi:hypothetical protein
MRRVWPILLWAACYDQGSLRRVGFSAIVQGAAAPVTVTTPSGWEVTFTAAQVSIGPFYFRDAEPNQTPSGGTIPGLVVDEVLAKVTVDALDTNPTSIPGGGRGTTERARTAEMRLVDVPFEGGTGIGRIAGTARKDAVELQFDGVVRVTASKESAPFNWFSDHQILNVEVDFNADEAGTLAIEVDPTHWLDFLDFDSLPDRGDGVRTFTDAQQTSLRAGVTSRAAFRFSWKGQNP